MFVASVSSEGMDGDLDDEHAGGEQEAQHERASGRVSSPLHVRCRWKWWVIVSSWRRGR